MTDDHKMIPRITNLKLPRLIETARCLSSKGYTQLSKNNYFYLNIDDAYIHLLFPLLENKEINKPEYFGEKFSGGAHITIIYPEEGKIIHASDLQQEHNFSVRDIAAADIGQKTYFTLLLESPSLVKLRKKYELPEFLCFKGYSIGLHITIAVGEKRQG